MQCIPKKIRDYKVNWLIVFYRNIDNKKYLWREYDIRSNYLRRGYIRLIKYKVGERSAINWRGFDHLLKKLDQQSEINTGVTFSNIPFWNATGKEHQNL